MRKYESEKGGGNERPSSLVSILGSRTDDGAEPEYDLAECIQIAADTF